MRTRIAIIGNAPLTADRSAEIDASDIVIRFNAAPEHGRNGGRKTTILFLANSGKTMQQQLKDPAFRNSTLLGNAEAIYLPYHPQIVRKYLPRPNVLSRLKGRKTDLTFDIVALCARIGKPVTIFPPAFYEESCSALGIAEADRRRSFPSSGYLAIRHMCARFAPEERTIALFGFNWQGWKRHRWDIERRQVEALVERGEAEVRP